MKYNYAGKSVEISDSLKERVEKKLGKLDKYFRDDAEVLIKLTQQKGARNIAEYTITVGSMILRAEEVSNDMYTSIDRAADKLEKQINRHRTKLEKRLRAGAFEPPVDAIDDYEEPVYDVVRTKKFSVKPMSVADAIAQMELLGHDFYLFLNEETDGLCVLYRRNDNTYGMLVPDI